MWRDYRKKPVVVQAAQFYPPNKPWPDGVEAYATGWRIQTLEGPHIVTPGDWVIRGIKGELYPCKPDIFKATYEAVGEEAPHA